MDPRMIPLNGLIALARGDGLWPRPLGDQGLQIHLFEAPVFTEVGNITADAVLYRLESPLVVLAECKGGRNVSALQARRYLSANVEGIFAAGSLPSTLRDRDDTRVIAVFVGNETHRSDLEASMTQHQIQAPLLTVGRDGARLTGVEPSPRPWTRSSLPTRAGLRPHDSRLISSVPPRRSASWSSRVSSPPRLRQDEIV